jgi:FSR family fosmidomycin resistance protein-like MFS transporter
MNFKIVLILSISHLFVDVTGTALPAMMPFLKDSLHLSYTAVGMVIMVSNLTSSIIQPAFGYLSDKVEIKGLLPLSFLVIYVGFSLTGLAPSFIVLLILVTLSGIGVAVYHPEGMKTMHYFAGSKKAVGMSFFQVGGNFGLALGPLLVTWALGISGLPGTLLFLILGIPTFAFLLLYHRKITEALQKEKKEMTRRDVSGSPVKKEGGWKSMSLLVLAVAMRSWAHMGLVTFVPFYYIQVLGGDALTAGRLVFIFLMGGVAGTMIGAVIAEKIGHKPFFGLSMILSTPLLFLFLQVGGIWLFILLFLVGLVLISSFSVTIVMGQRILSSRLGMASGLMMGFVIGIGGVGAGLLGIVADSWGILAVLQLITAMPAVGFIPVLLTPYRFESPENKPACS